jgi:purine-binding chemotaxis protein CheW
VSEQSGLTPETQARVLQERARALAAASVGEVNDAAIEVLLLRLGKERYAVDLRGLRSVQHSAGLTRVPCTSRHVAGILNVRGELVTVLDLAAILGLDSPATPEASTQVLLVEVHRTCVGLLVDEVLGVERLALDQLDGSLSGATHSRGVAEGCIVLLDVEQVLAEQSSDDTSESI